MSALRTPMELALQELHERQRTLREQMVRLQALQREVAELEARAPQDVKARECLMRVTQVVEQDLVPLKRKLERYVEEMRRDGETPARPNPPAHAGPVDTPPRKARPRSGRTFI